MVEHDKEIPHVRPLKTFELGTASGRSVWFEEDATLRLTRGIDSSCSRPACSRIASMSHVYTFWSSQPVTSTFPLVKRAAQYKAYLCWRGGPTWRLVLRFQRRAVLSFDALARRHSFEDKVIDKMAALAS